MKRVANSLALLLLACQSHSEIEYARCQLTDGGQGYFHWNGETKTTTCLEFVVHEVDRTPIPNRTCVTHRDGDLLWTYCFGTPDAGWEGEVEL